MKQTVLPLFFCIALVFTWGGVPVFAQEDDLGDPDQQEQETEPVYPLPLPGTDETYVYRANQRGDQFIQIALQVDLPIKPGMDKLYVGGEGMLGYLRFLNSFIAVGGTLGFGYHTTIQENVFYYVPVSAKVVYQYTYRKIEVPLSFSIGGAWESYKDRTYFGLFLKPELGVYLRAFPSWSFGVLGGCMFMPQTYDNSADNRTGVIANVGITARYHF
jgi:hypothetical protein